MDTHFVETNCATSVSILDYTGEVRHATGQTQGHARKY